MGVQVSFEELYAIAQNLTSISTTSDFEVTDIGVMLAKTKMLLTEHPSLAAGQNIIEQRKTTGSSLIGVGAAGYERVQGTRNPATTWPWDANAYDLALPLWLLFQKGASEATQKKTYVKYADSDCEVWANLLRIPGDTSAAHRMPGAIVRSITISSEEGGPLKASVEFIGYDLATDVDSSGFTLNIADKAPLLWQNAICELGNNEDTIYLPSFSVTITNNAISKFYDAQLPIRHILGDLTITGTFTLPWDSGANSQDGNQQIDDFIAGNDKLFNVYWGHKTAATLVGGDLALKFNIRYTGADLATPDEIVTECPFEVVDDDEHTPVSILAHDETTRNIP